MSVSIILCILISSASILSCTALQQYLDKTGIESSCKDIMTHYSPGNPSELAGFAENFTLSGSTAPFHPGIPEVKDMDRWKLDIPGNSNLIQEKLFFKTPLSNHTHPDDKLVLYIYRQGELKNSRLLLFIPGMGVSDLALFFIKNFFKEIIKRGYTLAVYIPPYHLERIPEGKETGQGFFTHDTVRNSKMITGCTAEIRSAAAFFRLQGVENISAWGGSMGASFLLLAAHFEKFSHLTLMIPVLDWNSLLLDNPGFCILKERLIVDGYNEETLRKLYYQVSPMNYNLLTKPDRVLFMTAAYDQLTSLKLTEKYREKHQSPLIKIYSRSHSTILTDYDIYKDYADQLDKWDSNKFIISPEDTAGIKFK